MKAWVITEWIKISRSYTFWILLGMYLLSAVLVFFGIERFINDVVKQANTNSAIPIPDFSIYAFPYVWHNLTFLAGYFKIFLAVIVVLFTTNEFSYKTARQNVINGFGRIDLLGSKILLVLSLAFVSSFFVFLSGLILGFTHTEQISFSVFISKTSFIPAYFLELTGFMSFAMMIGFMIRKGILSLGVLAVYNYIAEPVLNYLIDQKWELGFGDYLPLEVFSLLIDLPNSSLMKLMGFNFREYIDPVHVTLGTVYILLFFGISYLSLKRRDL